MTAMQDSKPPGQRQLFEDLIERLSDARTALAALGLLLYAVLRIAYSSFYAPLGITPDDLGLGYVDLLAQSAVGAAGLLLAYALLASLIVPIYVGATEMMVRSFREGLTEVAFVVAVLAPPRLRERVFREGGRVGTAVRRELADDERMAEFLARHERWDSETLSGAVVLLTAGITALFGVLGILDWKTVGEILLYGLVVFVGVSLAIALMRMLVAGANRIRRGLAGGIELRGKSTALWWRRGLVLVAVVVVGLAVSTLLLGARDDTEAIQDGRAARFTVLGVPITSWGAEAATLNWTTNRIDSALRPLDEQCLMYLGQSDGALFLYSPSSDDTHRVPATAGALRIRPDGQCEM